ncbi:PREDICTED: leucine-rich repeat extensin-like protein 5 [Theobroma cacao]|uniref:Leucine-rich repeat extensin-like protein 5 n=1 Tax=Theobroma cacao TaxID=3641 RepID=A0AB32WTA3_THECC|nr:PREDICTED: leucine-rich repeat extensin-like protein 5 [Theobroma cacao]
MPLEPATANTSATLSPAPAGQDVEGSTFQGKGHEPEVDKSRKSPSPKPQKEAKSEQAEKARPSAISSPQDPLEIPDKSSPEPSPQKSPQEPSLEPLNVFYCTDESTPSPSSEDD